MGQKNVNEEKQPIPIRRAKSQRELLESLVEKMDMLTKRGVLLAVPAGAREGTTGDGRRVRTRLFHLYTLDGAQFCEETDGGPSPVTIESVAIVIKTTSLLVPGGR